jgi:predicted DNA-binding transcriptional regulator AlpA
MNSRAEHGIAGAEPQRSDENQTFGATMKLLTFNQLKSEKGHPFTRVHTMRLVRDGKFPAPLHLSERRIAWSEAEIDAHHAALAANRNALKAA